MEDEINELILRMINKEKVANSNESIAWNAFREAENISNPNLINFLIQLLDSKKTKDERHAIYFILGKIGKNLNDTKYTELLISFLTKENDKYIISGILDRIAELPKNIQTNLDSIYRLLNNDKWLIRHSAIRSLNNSYSSRTELEIINMLKMTTDPYDMCYGNSVLNKIGTEQSLEILLEMMKSRKRDVKLSAKLAIDEIRKRLTNAST